MITSLMRVHECLFVCDVYCDTVLNDYYREYRSDILVISKTTCLCVRNLFQVIIMLVFAASIYY